TVATATGVNSSGGNLNNTNDPLVLAVTLATLGVAVGDPLACESELMTVVRDLGASGVLLARGRYGTTKAAHANGNALNNGTGIPAGRIPVGFIAPFAPAVAGPASAAAINNAACADGTTRPRDKAPTLWPVINAVSLAAGAELVVFSVAAEARTTALAETLAGANNAWNAAAMKGG